MPEGRAANQAFSVVTFSPPIGGVVAGRPGQLGGDRLAGELGGGDIVGRELAQRRLLLAGGRRVDAGVGGLAEVVGELPVQLRGGPARHGLDLTGQQRQQDAVLVRRPDAAVAAEERRTGGLLAAEADRSVEQARDEPLEADRHLDQPAAEVGDHAVDQRAGHQGLADGGVLRPSPAGG